MNCRDCGARLKPNDRFCAYCGNLTPYGEKQDLEKQREDERIKREKEEKDREESEQKLRARERRILRRRERIEALKGFAVRLKRIASRYLLPGMGVLFAVGAVVFVIILIGAVSFGVVGFLLNMLLETMASIIAIIVAGGLFCFCLSLGFWGIVGFIVLCLFANGCA